MTRGPPHHVLVSSHNVDATGSNRTLGAFTGWGLSLWLRSHMAAPLVKKGLRIDLTRE